MPRIGTPASNSAAGVRGLSASVTELGPPDRITPPGASRSNAASALLNGAISQYTPASRTRRAMSCVTWLPKSKMRTDWLGRMVMGAAIAKQEAKRMAEYGVLVEKRLDAAVARGLAGP